MAEQANKESCKCSDESSDSGNDLFQMKTPIWMLMVMREY